MRFERFVIDGLAVLEPAVKAAKKGSAATGAAVPMLSDGEIKSLGKKLAEAEEELASATEQIHAFRQS